MTETADLQWALETFPLTPLQVSDCFAHNPYKEHLSKTVCDLYAVEWNSLRCCLLSAISVVWPPVGFSNSSNACSGKRIMPWTLGNASSDCYGSKAQAVPKISRMHHEPPSFGQWLRFWHWEDQERPCLQTGCFLCACKDFCLGLTSKGYFPVDLILFILYFILRQNWKVNSTFLAYLDTAWHLWCTLRAISTHNLNDL